MISDEEMNERLKYRTDLSEADLHDLWMALKEKYPNAYDNYRNISNIQDEDEADQWVLGLSGFIGNHFYYSNEKYYNFRSEISGDMMSFAYRYLRDGAAERYNG